MLIFGPQVFSVGYVRLTQLTLVHKEVIYKWETATANHGQRSEQFFTIIPLDLVTLLCISGGWGGRVNKVISYSHKSGLSTRGTAGRMGFSRITININNILFSLMCYIMSLISQRKKIVTKINGNLFCKLWIDFFIEYKNIFILIKNI